MDQSPQPAVASGPAEDLHPVDAVESVVPYIPIVVPAVGAAMIFLLAFIAVYMA